MPKQSAGVLLYRRNDQGLEVFLVHPGGPFWAKKDEHAWSIPKGEFGDDESQLQAAEREFEEETGVSIDGTLVALEPVKSSGGKIIHAWLCEGDCDPAQLKSNLFSMEWPPRSGRQQEFPEVDRAEWYTVAEARTKLHKGQVPLLHQLVALVEG